MQHNGLLGSFWRFWAIISHTLTLCYLRMAAVRDAARWISLDCVDTPEIQRRCSSASGFRLAHDAQDTIVAERAPHSPEQESCVVGLHTLKVGAYCTSTGSSCVFGSCALRGCRETCLWIPGAGLLIAFPGSSRRGDRGVGGLARGWACSL